MYKDCALAVEVNATKYTRLKVKVFNVKSSYGYKQLKLFSTQFTSQVNEYLALQ